MAMPQADSTRKCRRGVLRRTRKNAVNKHRIYTRAADLLRLIYTPFATILLLRNLSGQFVLKLLIPVFDHHGAAEAARHSAFLFAERGMVEVEVVETTHRAGSDHAARTRRRRRTRDMLDATCAILKDAGVPYRLRHAAGPAERSIAACVECGGADIVLVDASHLGFLRKWMMLARLRRLCSVPVTLLH
ncbi:hypothetical protein [Paraburkholderia flagellata]|uniref:hypothetical protein n=1 Tax=Paraburkholderia flagellata TaxID=2883241 RepID=UPI001F384D74|nr:hypothetical protein [Paraburkholderia flagellata]